MNILDTIVAFKKTETARRKEARPIKDLQKQPFYARETFSLKKSLLNDSGTGIIAEFKRKSPSKGTINWNADILKLTTDYTKFGAAGLSVLTDLEFFGGSGDDLNLARQNQIPILRKDFIIDPYQLHESKAMGADVILLIAACLEPAQSFALARQARQLGLEVLLEVHNKEELAHICDEVDLVGVNNRNLKDFTIDLNRSKELAEWIPSEKIPIAESGIHETETIHMLRRHGFMGFLMGEHFMKEADPSIAFASFVQELKKSPHEGKSLRHDATRPGKKSG